MDLEDAALYVGVWDLDGMVTTAVSVPIQDVVTITRLIYSKTKK